MSTNQASVLPRDGRPGARGETRPRKTSLTGFAHRYTYPLLALTRRDLARTYGRTTLGRSWMVLQPALLLSLYIGVFGFILHVKISPDSGPGDFAVFLMSGMLPYLALADGIQRASSSLSDNRSLLNQAVFPAEVIPFSGVLGASLTEVGGLLIVAVFAKGFGYSIAMWLMLLPVLVVLRITITLGFACLVSVLTVFIPDLREMLGFLMTVWLFLTPVFYVSTAVPEGMRFLMELNPLYHLVTTYRAVLFSQPGVGLSLLKTAAFGGFILMFGVWFFRRTLTRARDLL